MAVIVDPVQKKTAYARGTKVAPSKTREEIDRALAKAGATKRVITEDEDLHLAIVAFMLGAPYRLEIPLPFYDPHHPPKERPTRWHYMTQTQRAEWNDGRVRERWRAILLLVKAKLEIVALGVSTVEREFLADLVLPGGTRLHAALAERLVKAFSADSPVPLLGSGT
jgi:hypothetical protein